MQTKSCPNPKCEQTNPQPVSEFYLNKRTKDGYSSYCKSCYRRLYEENREKRRLQRAEHYRTHKEKYKEYREANKERIAKKIKEYYEANPDAKKEYYKANMERHKENLRRWQKENREYLSARRRERRRENPEIMYAQFHRRRARKLGNGGSHTAEEWQDLCAFYDYRCLCCKEQKPLTRDHVIPITKGGSNDISNLQPLCQSCNSTKYDKIIDYRLAN